MLVTCEETKAVKLILCGHRMNVDDILIGSLNPRLTWCNRKMATVRKFDEAPRLKDLSERLGLVDEDYLSLNWLSCEATSEGRPGTRRWAARDAHLLCLLGCLGSLLCSNGPCCSSHFFCFPRGHSYPALHLLVSFSAHLVNFCLRLHNQQITLSSGYNWGARLGNPYVWKTLSLLTQNIRTGDPVKRCQNAR